MELEDRVYDVVDVTQGVSEWNYDSTTNGNRSSEQSGYKSLQKQNVSSVYAGISQSDTAVDVIATNGAKDKGKRQIVKVVLLFLCMLFLFLLSLVALSIAVASIVKLTNDLSDYRGELDRLTNIISTA